MRMRWSRALLWLGVVAAVALGIAVRLADSLPAPPSSPEVVPSVLFDRYGTPIAEIGPSVAHVPLGLEEMAPALVDAVVAAVDPEFLAEDGVDTETYASALGRLQGTAGRTDAAQGILQRYVEGVYGVTGDTPTQARKLLVELRLGRQLSRAEILERFLNIVYLGRGAYGVHAAAEVWFGTTAVDLSITQSAYLASLVVDPLGVDAAVGVTAGDNSGDVRVRRDRVLVAMYERGDLTAEELIASRAIPVIDGIRAAPGSGPNPGTHSETGWESQLGSYGAVRMLVPDAGLEAFVGEAYTELVDRYGPHLVVGGGLHVTTSIDLGAQRAAVTQARRLLGGGPSAAIAVLDRSGHVRVLANLDGSGPLANVGAQGRGDEWDLGGLFEVDHGGTAPLTWLIAPDATSRTVASRAGVLQVGEVFSILASQGERRIPRTVLAASRVPDQGRAPDLLASKPASLGQVSLAWVSTDQVSTDQVSIEHWPLQLQYVGDEAGIDSLRSQMLAFALPSGVEGLGRGVVVALSGDEWFAGWTSQFTAAVHVQGMSEDGAGVERALGEVGSGSRTRALELFELVLDPMQYFTSRTAR